VWGGLNHHLQHPAIAIGKKSSKLPIGELGTIQASDGPEGGGEVSCLNEGDGAGYSDGQEKR